MSRPHCPPPNLPSRRRRGFTLLELTIAVATVGLLAAVAIPAYQNYTKRSRIANVLVKMGDFRSRAMEYLAETGRFPASEQNLGIGQWTDHAGVDFLAIDINIGNANADADNTIEIFASLKPSVYPGGILSLRGARDASGNVTWACGQTSYDNLPNALLPRECRR